MSDEDRWRGTEPPAQGPSAPPDLNINPLAGGIAVFSGVAIPIVVVGYTLSAGPSTLIIALGVVVGLLAGVLAGIWLAHRGGQVWRGPRL